MDSRLLLLGFHVDVPQIRGYVGIAPTQWRNRMCLMAKVGARGELRIVAVDSEPVWRAGRRASNPVLLEAEDNRAMRVNQLACKFRCSHSGEYGFFQRNRKYMRAFVKAWGNCLGTGWPESETCCGSG